MNLLVKNNDPAVGVIIVNYNSGNKLLLCVESLLSVESELHIVIVDNASTDQSLAKLNSTISNDSRVQLIQNQENLGFAVACNMGARLARGDYLLYLNPDCKIHKEAISKLLNCLANDSKIGMAGGHLLNSDGSEQIGGRRAVPTPWRSLVRVFHLSFLSNRYPRLFSDFNLHLQPLPNHPIEVEAISGACMMVSRTAYEDVGGLDEGYFLHCEDLDWCMSFRKKGWKVKFVPAAKISHFQGACSRSRRVFVEWYKHKGMMRFYQKHFRHQYPGIIMWFVVLGVWIRFGLLACYFSVRRFLISGKQMG
ncbi:glycosyltransferase family 2 protein [Gimesia aquarii]|uniref:N-acetylglucosaminyl-diphospho-decaprenol L-rhamnosyltransferase n=1 Tax=Gimesia aquarii TaxID=2527964 RepID=A0A517X0C5_9PLAN|nr:glycosyltransferase family 2 protein [Gimesia aquarii]QDU10959.1 N-acetylglucosaminyl-diphospho-decaprenol L-rhamnosyltransferase [Gimesia aquarii]